MVGGREERRESSSLEEDSYWTNFQFTHFSQILRNNNLQYQHFEIPKTFSLNTKKKLPRNVILKGHGGAIWNIELTKKDDTLYFTQGWEKFVKDNSLKENDFIAFKYDGDALFDVVILHQACGPANVLQHGGGGNSKKREMDNSSAGVEVARTEQFAADGVANTEPSYVPSQTTSKRVKKHANKRRARKC